MADKRVSLTPVALASGSYTTNILYPAAAGAGGVGYTATASKIVIRKITIINTTAGALTYRLHKTTTGGAAAAGNAIAGAWDRSVAANSRDELFCSQVLDGSSASDYLVGGASGAGLTINVDFDLMHV